MNKICAIFLSLLFVVPVWATTYDFKKEISGQTLYFSVLSTGEHATVSVVAPQDFKGYGDFVKPKGRLVIPGEVQHDGERYRVSAIAPRAFADCDALTSVIIPVTVSCVGSAAFENCSRMHSVVIECDSVGIFYDVFKGCVNLDSVVVAPTARCLPPFAFHGVENLKVVVFLAENAVSMRNVFFGCGAPARIVFGERVSMVPSFLCYNFTGLNKIEFPDNAHCMSTIGQCAFANCASLRNVTIPASVSMIGANAFAYCRLQSLVLESELPPCLEEQPFFGVDRSTEVMIPCGTRQSYVNSAMGRCFDHFVYPKTCPIDPIQAEVIYVHDTVWLHDTVYLPESAFRQWLASSNDTVGKSPSMYDYVEVDLKGVISEKEPSEWIFLDGKIVRITHAKRLAGTAVKAYDENGRLVVDERIPANQPADNYYLRLPKRKRYFLAIGNLPTVSVDVAAQRVNH